MLPALQPSRPKPPQQRPQPTYTHNQTRAIHETPQTPSIPHIQPRPSSSQPQGSWRPRSQIEAMPPFAPSPFSPPRTFYDSAIRHPVFFTDALRKPPFPMPQVASQGWNPVASGYIMEQRRREGDGLPKTKL